jgi:hypothetical protein
MYSYHNRLKKLLKSEEYVILFGEGEFAYRFFFPRINKSMPIRGYRIDEYKKFLNGGKYE